MIHLNQYLIERYQDFRFLEYFSSYYAILSIDFVFTVIYEFDINRPQEKKSLSITLFSSPVHLSFWKLSESNHLQRIYQCSMLFVSLHDLLILFFIGSCDDTRRSVWCLSRCLILEGRKILTLVCIDEFDYPKNRFSPLKTRVNLSPIYFPINHPT